MKKTVTVQMDHEVLSLITGIAFSNVPCWYGATRRDLRMDLIVPKVRERHEKLPAVIWVCGGAFMVVDRSVWMPELLRFARAGYVVAGIEYRTSNEAQFPAPLLDVKTAIRFLKAHAEEYCVDPERIFIMGESAGGSLAGLAGVTAARRVLEPDVYPDTDSSVRGVVDFYGVSFIDSAAHSAGGPVPHWATEAYLGTRFSKEQADAAGILTYISDKTPPFLILHGTSDTVVPIEQSERLYAALVKKHIPVTYLKIKGAHHGDDLFYQDAVTETILRFLDSLAGRCAGAAD